MRLTKSDKEAFVRAVMDDVPQADYSEQVRSKLNAWGLESLPEEMRPLAKKYPDYFKAHYISTPSHCPSVQVVCDPNWSWSGCNRGSCCRPCAPSPCFAATAATCFTIYRYWVPSRAPSEI